MASQPAVINKKSLADQTYELLRQQIICGTLSPGERLNVFDLATQFGISRTPIKDAINRLSLDGLVTIHPQSGTFVSRLRIEQIREIFEARLMIELWSVPRLISVETGWDSSAAAALLDRCECLFHPESDFNYSSFVDCDREFHHLITQAVRNQRIGMLCESVYPHIQLLRVYWGRSPDRAWKSHREHMEILSAIEERNEAEVRQRLRDHITGSCEDVIRLLTQDHHPLVAETENAMRDPDTKPAETVGFEFR